MCGGGEGAEAGDAVGERDFVKPELYRRRETAILNYKPRTQPGLPLGDAVVAPGLILMGTISHVPPSLATSAHRSLYIFKGSAWRSESV